MTPDPGREFFLLSRPTRRSVSFSLATPCSDFPQASFNLVQRRFHAFHLFIVLRPHFAAFYRLPFGHLCGPDNLVHEISEYPDSEKAERNDEDNQGTKAGDSEKDLELVTCRDNQQCEVDNNEKRLAKVEPVFLSEEELTPAGKTTAKLSRWN